MKTFISLAASLALAISATPTFAAAQNASMHGTWQLNEDESDDPGQALQRRRSAADIPDANRGRQRRGRGDREGSGVRRHQLINVGL